MVQTQHSEGRSYVLFPAWVKGRKKHRAVAKGLIGKVDMIVTEGTPVSKANNVLIALGRTTSLP